MLKKITLVLIVSSLLSPCVISQDSNYKIFLKGGISNYGAVQGIQVSGGGGPGQWYDGPIVGFGFEYDLKRNWHLQGSIEYSYNIYGAPVASTESLERGSNSVVDIMANIKKRWNWFYMIGGIGLSSQNSNNSYKSGYVNEFYFRREVYQGYSKTVLTGLFGIGVEVYFIQNIGIFLEGSWRIREYVTPVAQLGINYRL